MIRANPARERLPQLLKLRDDLEAVLVLLRLAEAFKGFQAYQYTAELVVTACRQNEGRIRSADTMALAVTSPRRWPGSRGVSAGFRPAPE